MHRPIKKTDFIAFDTETTGISALTNEIVEIAAVRFNIEDGPLEYYQTLVKPQFPIPPALVRIHGISNQMVKDAPTIAKVLPTFFQFLDGAVPIAHNARFDVDFISIQAMRAGLLPPQVTVLDSCRLARKLMPGYKSYSLGNITRELNIESDVYHRAMADSVLCMDLTRKLLQADEIISKTALELVKIQGGTVLEFDKAVTPLQQVPKPFESIVTAIKKRQPMWIQYGDSYGQREITPHTLFVKGKNQYLEATCHFDDLRKTYRLDRISKITFAQSTN